MTTKSVNLKINTCRICLSDTKNEYCVSLDEGEDLLKLFEFCFGIIILPEDLPRKLCGVCFNKMKDYSELKKQSIKSDKLWREIISVNSITCIEKCVDDVVIKEENDDYDACADNIDHEYNTIDSYVKEEGLSTLNETLQGTQDDNKNHVWNTKIPTDEYVEQNGCYSCQSCKATFKLLKDFKRHMKNNKSNPDSTCISKTSKGKDSSKTKYYCGLCDEKTLDKTLMNEHLDTHSSNNDLSCKLCEFTGRDFADMLTHRYTHQIRPSKCMSCHKCEKKSFSAIGLQFHYRSVHLKKPGGMCSICSKTFVSYKSLKKHERRHGDVKFHCDLCGRKFLFRHEIEAHLIDHSDYKGFVCDICGNKFRRNANLRLHIAQVHDDKSVHCSHCNRTFKNEKNHKIHLLKAAREKKYKCDGCPKAYATVSELRNHKIWHADERPFACQHCGAAFKVKSQLTVHVRSHTGNLPYKCTIANCPKAFACSNQLKVHLNVHSGVRRYKCPYCDKTFHNRCNIATHCAKRHTDVEVVVDESKKPLGGAENSIV